MFLTRRYLEIAAAVLCAVALVIGFRKKCLNTLPWFFSKLAYQVLQTVAAVALFHASDDVYYSFVLFAVLAGSSLDLGMFYELANKLIPVRPSIARFLVRPLLRWSLAVLVLLATITAALFHPQLRNRLASVSLTLNLAMNIIALGLVVTLLLLTRIVGVRWRSLSGGVALGLGVSSAPSLVGSALFGLRGKGMMGDLIIQASWNVCVLIWVFYLLFPERPPKTREAVMLVWDLERQSQELQNEFSALNPGPSEFDGPH